MNQSSAATLPETNPNTTHYSHLTTHYEANHKLGWYFMHASPRACFTSTLLADLQSHYASVRTEIDAPDGREYKYLVAVSDVPGVFNLGGDLELFTRLIRANDRDGLMKYAVSCINALYETYIHLNRDITTISLVQGDALGGGFEGALSSNVLIAERGTKMGFPEILFNLFPGMGAYNLLSRKIGSSKAEQMILSGQLYGAEELYEMGVVDVLAEKGEGELAVYDYIKRAERAPNGYRAMREVKDISGRISYQELLDVTKIWVDAALRLEKRDLRMMERLVSRQTSNRLNVA